jgi:hypothetical protein
VSKPPAFRQPDRQCAASNCYSWALGACSGAPGGQWSFWRAAEELQCWRITLVRCLVCVQVGQGRPHIFCDMRIVDDTGRELERDGQAVGNLQVGGGFRQHMCGLRIRHCYCLCLYT